MIFDNKLKWTSHIKKLKNRCKVRINIIKSLSCHTQGASMKSLNIVYKSLIISQIQYGSQICITAKKKILKVLDPIHNKGIRLSAEAFRISPTVRILCYAGELPFNLLRKKELLFNGIKRKNIPNHLGYYFNNKTTNRTNSIKDPCYPYMTSSLN